MNKKQILEEFCINNGYSLNHKEITDPHSPYEYGCSFKLDGKWTVSLSEFQELAEKLKLYMDDIDLVFDSEEVSLFVYK